MKNMHLGILALQISLSVVTLPAKDALAQRAFDYQGRLTDGRSPAKSSLTNVAAANSTGVEVIKTAFVDGQNVCGAIRIKNVGSQSATVSGIADSLEVHFPRDASSGALPAGSTRTWFKVADVPIPLPGPIAPGKTTTIDYCFSLCLAADFPGANSIRNVVTVSLTDQAGIIKLFTTRSTSFPPPVLDCQACCLPDGSCTDTVSDGCAAAGGSSQGAATDCASTECLEACCRPDDSCTFEGPSACRAAEGEPQGAGTDCTSTQCCAPMRVPNTCDETADCCTETAKCLNGECCILSEDSGCNLDSDCCTEGQVCEAGTCCAPLRVSDTCVSSGDCCTPGGKCLNGECCISPNFTGCNSDSDCCVDGQICEAGTCCAPMRVSDTCTSSGDCCTPGGKCLNGECCISPNFTGCNSDSECCVDGQICEAGTCCAPLRVANTCQSSVDCCTPEGKCLNGECCISTNFTGCNLDSDCCTEGQTCVAGACCRGFLGSCINDLDCCSGLVCSGGLCDRLIGP
jgi:hypothetical protein